MTRRREIRPITKHSINLYTGDYEKLMSLYSTRIGAAKIIRDVIRAHIRKIEEDAAQKLPLVSEFDMELEEAADNA